MKSKSLLLILPVLTSLLAEASFLPTSISHTKSFFNSRGWWREKTSQAKSLEPGDYPKYFHEPEGNDLAHHYDTRYSHGVLSHETKQDTQIHLIRSYLQFFQKNRMETWLAHGTLLGWWWNGHSLPWDWDIDTQVSVATLVYLAEQYNSTIYKYTSGMDAVINTVTGEEEPLTREYHLDINPAIYTRYRGDGDNVIDARWIDIRNGLYIDITGVAETHPQDSPGIWSCKNYHRYKTSDLWPMRETIYEGVTAKVPYTYQRVLMDEYGEKALVVEEYQSHRWSAADSMWVKKTPAEMKQQRLDRQAVRRKKQEAEAKKKKLQQEEEKERQMAKDQQLKEKEDKEREEKAKAAELEQRAEGLKKEPTKDRARERREESYQDMHPVL